MSSTSDLLSWLMMFFFFQAEDGIREYKVTGVQTCALPISGRLRAPRAGRQELRRNRRHYGLQPGHREEPPQSGPEQLRAAHRALAGVGTPQALTHPHPPCQGVVEGIGREPGPRLTVVSSRHDVR